ncbi:MAG: hypothetical protein ACE5H0_12660, partial [Bacteroidota bacterium]
TGRADRPGSVRELATYTGSRVDRDGRRARMNLNRWEGHRLPANLCGGCPDLSESRPDCVEIIV